MTILTRISNYFHSLISKFLSEDEETNNDDGVYGAEEGNLTDFLAAAVDRELTEEAA